jgi:hypothetical protein
VGAYAENMGTLPVFTTMNPKLTIKKLIGHSNNLLTFYLGTVRKYAMLDPMIFSEDVCTSNGSDVAAEGFKILRSTLYYGVVQDIANIVFDNGKSNPSIINIHSMLESGKVVEYLRKNYVTEYVDDEDLIEVYKERAEARGKEFDGHMKELSELIESLKSNTEVRSTKSIRDKFTAHIDLQYINGTYEYPDISKYGLQWASLRKILSDIKPVIERIGFVVRDAGFDWESFEQQNLRISKGYWGR